MLATSERVRPCSDLELRSSSGRLTTTSPVVGALDRQRLDDRVAQGALRTLDRDVLAVDRDVDAGRNGDGELANSRHVRPRLPDVGEDFPTYALLASPACRSSDRTTSR